MRYAIVENGIVTNIIWKYPTTEIENSIPCEDIPVAIGDTYTDGKFYRDGVQVLSPLEDMEAALEVLGVTP